MTSTTYPGDVFVGRKAQQQAFGAALDELAAARGKASGKGQRPRAQARVFLIHGSGGMGKTELLRQFARQCKGHGDSISWVLLNWDVEHDAGRLPRDFPALAVRLRNAIVEQLGADARRHFKAFDEAHKSHGEVEAEVELVIPRVWAEYQKVAPTLATIGGGVAEAGGAAGPVPPKLLAAIVELGVHAGGAGAFKFAEFLERRLRQSLGDDYRLYINADDQYASSFVQGLVSLAKARPLVIAQDTYEWVSTRGQVDERFRALVVRPATQQSDGLTFVIAGRDDLGDEYRRLFESERHLLYVDAIKPFTDAETGELLRAYALPQNLSEEVQRKTLGVPLAVDALAILNKSADRTLVASQFPDVKGVASESDVIQQTTERFLRYLVEAPQDAPEVARQKRADRHRTYALALLRTYDPGALAACWGALDGGAPLSANDVLALKQELWRRNEFLFERGRDRMQREVQHFIRASLRQQVQPDAASLERDVIHRLSQAALDYYQQALVACERALPTIDERTEDPEWKSLCLSVLNHKLWLDERDALKELGRRMLEAGNTQDTWVSDLTRTAGEASPRDQGLLGALERGVESLLSDRPDIAAIQRMWDEVGARLPGWRLPPLYRALLAYHRGKTLSASGRPAESARELEAGLGALPPGVEPPLRERLINGLVGCAAILVLERREYRQAISITQRALQHDPGSVQAQRIRVMAMMGLKDYDGAHAVLDELIAVHPDVMDLRWPRLMLYSIQGRMAEFGQELRSITKTHPEFAQDAVRLLAEMGEDPQRMKALKEWQQDVGTSPQELEMFTRLQSALPPETLGELMGAYFELMAAESPTPEQLLRTRELWARHLPDWPEMQTDLGIAYLKAGRMQDALDAFHRAEALAPNEPRAATVPGLVLSWSGHAAEALPFLERGARLLPGNPGPAMMLVSSLQELGRLDEAKARAEAVLKDFPNSPLMSWVYGAVLLASGDMQRGMQILREAYRTDRSVIEVIKVGLLLQASWGSEHLKRQVKTWFEGDIGQVLSDLPTQDMVRLYTEVFRAALESDQAGQMKPEIAAPALEELLGHKPDSWDIRLELASLYEQAGDRGRAISLLEETVGRTPRPAQDTLRRLLAVLYARARQLPLAVHQIQALEGAASAEDCYVLAELHDALDEPGEAADAYDRALALADDQDTNRLERYIRCNFVISRFSRAEELALKLDALLPQNSGVHDYLSEALYRQGRYEDARNASIQALALAPESPTTLARLSRICQAMGLPEEAESYRQKALQMLKTAEAYNQACALALLGQQDEALARLAEATRDSSDLRAWAAHDPDFLDLRGNAVFEQTVR